MSQMYAQLLDEWRAAVAATREAQQVLTEKLEAHLAGQGPAPTEKDIRLLRELRELENAKLAAAMRYVQETALGPVSQR